jgi:curved DNA-binding protein CbpA
MSTPGKNLYSILGASEEATHEELERCYKRQAHRHHPDLGGDEEEMKAINQAWRVLGDRDARRLYDARRNSHKRYAYHAHTPVSSPAAQADAVYGRIAGAVFMIGGGLVLIFLVRVHYVLFLWPLALLGFLIVLFGIFMAHGALSFARERMQPTHFARRFIWAQELAFWSFVGAGLFGVVYLMAMV